MTSFVLSSALCVCCANRLASSDFPEAIGPEIKTIRFSDIYRLEVERS